MPVIDDLQIRIQGEAVRANDAIDKLVGKLDRLSTSINALNGKNLSSLANGVQRLSGSMASMNSVKTSDFTRLAKNIEKLSALDSGKIKAAAGSIHQFTNSLSGLNAVSVTATAQQVGDLAKGIAQLGYKSATKAITNIPQLASAMNQLMTTLSKAPHVSQNIIDMTNALAKLARTGGASGSAAKALSKSLGTYSTKTKKATKNTFNLASAIGKLYATYWMLFRAFRLVGKSIDISSSLTEVQNVVNTTFGSMSKKVEEFSKNSIQQFGMSELSVKKYASTFQAMGSAMGIDSALIGSANKFLSKQTNEYIGLSDSMADVSLNLTKLTADMASFYNVEQKDVADDLASIFTGSTRPLRQYGLDLTEATLQEWALKQGLDANINSMSQAEKTMLRYQYVLSNTGAAHDDFARTANTWANQVRILKQNFEQLGAVVGGTFINMLKPLVKALNNAMSHIIAFAQVVSNALGKIFGWTYEENGGGIAADMEDAADASGDIAGGISDAEKSAKKLKSHLLSIDELNVLDTNTDTGASGGGGSGGSSGGAASGGQWIKQDSMFKAFESEIDTLYELGEHINKTLIKTMEKIDWERIYKKAKNFGRGLAQFLNGLISPELFRKTGKTIASSINTALHVLNSFGKTFNWTEFGKSLSASIKGFFNTWDAGLTANTLSVFATGIIKAIKGAIEGFTEERIFVDIGQKIVDFICGINWQDINWELREFFESFANAIIQLPLDFAEGVAQSLVDKIFGKNKIDIDFSKFYSGDLFNVLNPNSSPVKKAVAAGNILMDVFKRTADTVATESERAKNVSEKNFNGLSGTITSQSEITYELTKKNFTNLSSSVSQETNNMKLYGTENFEKLKKAAEEKTNVLRQTSVENFVKIKENVSSNTKTAQQEASNNFEAMKRDIDSKTGNAQKIVNQNFELMKTDITKKLGATHTEFEKFGNSVNSTTKKIDGFYGYSGRTFNVILPTTTFSNFFNIISKVVSKLKDFFGFNGKKVEVSTSATGSGFSQSSGGFANGGYPEPATYFWAGENGVPEILGTVGGKTAVAGGAEITGIRQAVYDVGQSETALLRTAVSLLQVIASKDTSVTIGGRELVNAYDSAKSRNGFSFT